MADTIKMDDPKINALGLVLRATTGQVPNLESYPAADVNKSVEALNHVTPEHLHQFSTGINSILVPGENKKYSFEQLTAVAQGNSDLSSDEKDAFTNFFTAARALQPGSQLARLAAASAATVTDAAKKLDPPAPPPSSAEPKPPANPPPAGAPAADKPAQEVIWDPQEGSHDCIMLTYNAADKKATVALYQNNHAAYSSEIPRVADEKAFQRIVDGTKEVHEGGFASMLIPGQMGHDAFDKLTEILTRKANGTSAEANPPPAGAPAADKPDAAGPPAPFNDPGGSGANIKLTYDSSGQNVTVAFYKDDKATSPLYSSNITGVDQKGFGRIKDFIKDWDKEDYQALLLEDGQQAFGTAMEDTKAAAAGDVLIPDQVSAPGSAPVTATSAAQDDAPRGHHRSTKPDTATDDDSPPTAADGPTVRDDPETEALDRAELKRISGPAAGPSGRQPRPPMRGEGFSPPVADEVYQGRYPGPRAGPETPTQFDATSKRPRTFNQMDFDHQRACFPSTNG